jgi:uncharacterized protein (TIGR03435 family)
MIGTTISGTRVTMTAYTVSNLITAAYGLKDYQVADATGWIDSNRYGPQGRSCHGEPAARVFSRPLKNSSA